jgi:VanZ family protein
MGFLTYWSAQPTLPIDIPGLAALLHRLAHVGAWAILAALDYWALRGWPRRAVLAWLLAAAFGVLDEWHQAFTPGRSARLEDALVDAAAAAGALLLITAAARRPWRAPRR